MPIEYFSDAATFAQQAQPFLLKHEAENSLIFGISDRLAKRQILFSAAAPGAAA